MPQIIPVDSISNLRAVSSAAYTYAKVTGYYAAIDGGGGFYEVDPADTTSADNGGTIIVASDGARWKLQFVGEVSAKQLGAHGNGIADDSAVFGGNILPCMLVGRSSGLYRISTNTTITADLDFKGGQITVDSGVTLTIDSSISAPSSVIFKGAGTVVINRGTIDVAWFDGTDASSKWAFCARGIQNTNGSAKHVTFSTPSPTDPWAVIKQIGGNGVWGPRWRVDSTIIVDAPQQATVFHTPAGFVATSQMMWMWQFGMPGGALKVDYCHFPDKLSIEGNDGMCTYAGIMYGSSHVHIPYQEIYRTGGWLMQPTQNKQVSDIKFDFMDSGGLYGPILTFDGSSGANNSITDFTVDFISSTGFTAGYAPNALVQMNSNYGNIKIGGISHRAVTTGMVDATGGVVSLYNVGATNGNYFGALYNVHIGPVINGSTTITAEAIQVADGSGGRAAKHAGIVIEAGSLVNGGTLPADISLSYTAGAIVQGLQPGRKISVGSTCSDTRIYGVTYSQVIDGGSGTLINGRSIQGITPIALSAPPFTWVNNFSYEVDFEIQLPNGAITTVNYTRGTTTVPMPASGTTGSWRVSAGDNIALNWTTTGTASANIIPR